MWIYKHECFHRDQPNLLDKLRRKTSGNKNNATLKGKAGGISPTGMMGHPLNRPGDRWSELYDERTGHYYYYNHRTGMSQWEPPQLPPSPRGYMSGSTSSSALSSAGGSGSPRGSDDSDGSGTPTDCRGEYEPYTYQGPSPRDSPSRFDQQAAQPNPAAARRPAGNYNLDADEENLEFTEQDEQLPTPRGASRTPAPSTWSRQSSTSSAKGKKRAERAKRVKREGADYDGMDTDEDASGGEEDGGSDEEYIPASEQRRGAASGSRRESTANLLEGAALQMARLKDDGRSSPPLATSPTNASKPRVDSSLEMDPALAILALLNLPGGEEDEKLRDADWMKLQAMLTASPSSLSEAGLPNAPMGAAQLLHFCSRTYPSGRPRQLHQGLEDVLAKKTELTGDFKAYRATVEAERSPSEGVAQPQDNELLLIRDFMAFAVSTMQGLRDALPAEQQDMLALCVATWSKTAQLYI
jgi:hypothetical protein